NAKGKTDKALRLYNLADKLGGMNYHSKIGYGYFLLKNAYLREARAEFVKLSMNPKLKDDQKQQVKSLLALVTWKEGQIDDAIEMLQETMESYVTSMVYQSLGLLYIIKKDKEKALPFCLEAYEYNSDDNVIMDNLAEAYVLMGETEKAMKTYEELLKREPHFPDAYYGYGMLLIQDGKRREGLSYLEKALDKKFSFLSALPRERVEAIYYAQRQIEIEDKNNI
ncbi:MAG: tetratricopeptide repeat protein, partial [Clostridia bacterium]|nr:tetratricopeptide repeat protein [Clostridia bacterium]